MPEPHQPKRGPQAGPSLWRLASLGIDLAAAVGGFTLIGWLADRHWGVFPRYTITGAVLGLIGGMYNLVRQSLGAARESAHPGPRDSQDADKGRDP